MFGSYFLRALHELATERNIEKSHLLVALWKRWIIQNVFFFFVFFFFFLVCVCVCVCELDPTAAASKALNCGRSVEEVDQLGQT